MQIRYLICKEGSALKRICTLIWVCVCAWCLAHSRPHELVVRTWIHVQHTQRPKKKSNTCLVLLCTSYTYAYRWPHTHTHRKCNDIICGHADSNHKLCPQWAKSISSNINNLQPFQRQCSRLVGVAGGAGGGVHSLWIDFGSSILNYLPLPSWI